MSEHERFLVTFDSARGVPAKVEQIGEAGELTEMDLQGFLRLLIPGPAATMPQQITINIYGGGTQGITMPLAETSPRPPKPPHCIIDDDDATGGRRPYKTKKEE